MITTSAIVLMFTIYGNRKPHGVIWISTDAQENGEMMG